MFDILMFLFESYFNTDHYPDYDQLTIKLNAAGFENDDISNAINWLSGLENLSASAYPDTINQSSIRIFSDSESRILNTDCQNFILFWENQKLITPVEREMIIDRAIAYGQESLTLDKIRLIIMMVLWSQHDELDPLLIEELMAGTQSASLH